MTSSHPIFIVDDDDAIRDLLANYLKKNGFCVETAPDGERFLELFRSMPADVTRHAMVILDIMMPGMDGFAVCRELRTFSRVPVIMLTAVSDEMDRIVGLELGADDYLAKPFNPRELLARIKAIYRRSEPLAEPLDSGRYFYFNHFCLDTTTRELTSPEGHAQSLSGADYNLLMLFLSHPGQVLSRDAIAESTRKRDSAPLDRFIDVHISRLRHCLGENARNPEIIKTVRGSGYLMATEVSHSNQTQTVHP
ncbi:response regulator [Endozoicomonas numazuensis]|uniref:Transcriptional regulator n=1 Tax=Endozoicomonas numazuensis TaxID=1137799 RepID=A0A081NGV6_9GAMM|nr:response regulator transcription factor [Endozoicomonas numazuensis]KEQ17679.1 transcriptional regulator [Endozoicomonas numazuensis]